MRLNVFDICREGTRVLGPGCRYVLWVQGCKQRCKGCITPESQDTEKGTEMECADIAADIILSRHIDGITISGGEPFLQAEALAAILRLVKEYRPELTVIVYTGYEYSQLTNIHAADCLLALTDVLIDGPYVDSLNHNKGIAGSSNQRMIALTHRLDNFLTQMKSEHRQVQHVANADGTFSSIGVPPKH